MLHTHSYNMGLAAGTMAKANNLPRPTELTEKEFPGLLEILDKSDSLDIFLPSSFVEGYLVAYDHPTSKFSQWYQPPTPEVTRPDWPLNKFGREEVSK